MVILVSFVSILGGGYFDPITVVSGDRTYRFRSENGEVRVTSHGMTITDKELRTILNLAKRIPGAKVQYLKK